MKYAIGLLLIIASLSVEGMQQVRESQNIENVDPNTASAETLMLERIQKYVADNRDGHHNGSGFHARALESFMYVANNRPTEYEIAAILDLVDQEKFAEIVSIRARIDYCNDRDHDWQRDANWSVFHHIKAIAKELYWTPEDTVLAGKVFLNYLKKLDDNRIARAQKQAEDYMRVIRDIVSNLDESKA